MLIKSLVRMALAKIGERVPLAYRFSKILGDLVLNRCGPLLAPQADDHGSSGTQNVSHAEPELVSMQTYFNGIQSMNGQGSTNGLYARAS